MDSSLERRPKRPKHQDDDKWKDFKAKRQKQQKIQRKDSRDSLASISSSEDSSDEEADRIFDSSTDPIQIRTLMTSRRMNTSKNLMWSSGEESSEGERDIFGPSCSTPLKSSTKNISDENKSPKEKILTKKSPSKYKKIRRIESDDEEKEAGENSVNFEDISEIGMEQDNTLEEQSENSEDENSEMGSGEEEEQSQEVFQDNEQSSDEDNNNNQHSDYEEEEENNDQHSSDEEDQPDDQQDSDQYEDDSGEDDAKSSSSLDSLVEQKEKFCTHWEDPLKRICGYRKLDFKYFNVKKMEKQYLANEFIFGHRTLTGYIRSPAQNPREQRLIDFNAIKEYRLYHLAKKFPTPAFSNLLVKLEERSQSLDNNGKARYAQKYGSIFEMEWHEERNDSIYSWIIIHMGKDKVNRPPGCFLEFEQTRSRLFKCRPLIKDTPGHPVSESEKDAAICALGPNFHLINETWVSLSTRPIFSVLGPEVKKQLTSTTISFVDQELGMVVWLSGSSKITRPVFFVDCTYQRAII